MKPPFTSKLILGTCLALASTIAYAQSAPAPQNNAATQRLTIKTKSSPPRAPDAGALNESSRRPKPEGGGVMIDDPSVDYLESRQQPKPKGAPSTANFVDAGSRRPKPKGGDSAYVNKSEDDDISADRQQPKPKGKPVWGR